MKLYDAMTPNSLRVKIFLAEKGVDISRVPVAVMDGETRTPSFLAKNPMGELPLLELDDGSYLAESVAICRYLEGLHPEPRLFGEGAREQAHIEMWHRRAERHFFDPIGFSARHSFEFFKDKIEQIPEYAAASMRLFDEMQAWWDHALSDGRPYLAGERFSIADISMTPGFFVADMMQKETPEKLKHLKAYEARLRARSSFSGSLTMAA